MLYKITSMMLLYKQRHEVCLVLDMTSMLQVFIASALTLKGIC